MCRLFGLHADWRVVTATFWLLDAPDNLSEQSKRNPDGTGLGAGRDGSVFAVNVLLCTATDMWALRYPETHELYMLDRRAVADRPLRMRSHRVTAHSEHLTHAASVVFASEPMDDDDWQILEPGELVHVDADLQLTRHIAFPEAPKHQLRHEDLTATAAASQHASVA
jgi:predicted glutamine amidotransferase